MLGATAPRPKVAHGETPGFVAGTAQAPEGAKEPASFPGGFLPLLPELVPF